MPHNSFIQHSIASCSQSNEARKTNKDMQIRKEEVKLTPFVDDIISYIKNPKH